MYVHINLMAGMMQGFPMTPSLVLTGLSAATMAARSIAGSGLVSLIRTHRKVLLVGCGRVRVGCLSVAYRAYK